MGKLDRGVQWLEKAIIVVAFLVMVAVSFAQVVARFVFEDPISWSEEVARFLFVWITMVGAGHAVALNKHFCVDFLVSRLPAGARMIVGLGISVCVFAFAAIMLGFGGYVTQFTKFQSSPALLIPMAYPYLCIPLAGLFIIVHVLSGLAGVPAPAEPAAEGGYAE